MIDPDNLRRQYESMSIEELQNLRVNAVLAEEAQKILDKVLKTKQAARLVGKNLEERAKQLFEASPLVLELREYTQEVEQRIEDGKKENWFYTLDGQVHEGPVSLNIIRSLIQSGKINKNTLVWYPQLNEWQKAEAIDALFPKKSSTA